MGFKEWIVPSEKKFFDLLEEEAKIVREGVEKFVELVNGDGKNISEIYRKIEEIEHRNDEQVHVIIRELNKTFITPIDREDISGLALTYDEIIDYVEAATKRMMVYNLDPTDRYIKKYGDVLMKSVISLEKGTKSIRYLPKGETIERTCIDVNEYENEGDDLLLEALTELFRNTSNENFIEIIKRKEIYEMLEVATDKCEDVANVLGDIMVKNS